MEICEVHWLRDAVLEGLSCTPEGRVVLELIFAECFSTPCTMMYVLDRNCWQSILRNKTLARRQDGQPHPTESGKAHEALGTAFQTSNPSKTENQVQPWRLLM